MVDSTGRQLPTPHPEPVEVLVDHSGTALDDVLAASRRAARLGVPLEIRVEEPPAGPVGLGEHITRAHLVRRVHLAAELARAVEPELDVRLPGSEQLAQR